MVKTAKIENMRDVKVGDKLLYVGENRDIFTNGKEYEVLSLREDKGWLEITVNAMEGSLKNVELGKSVNIGKEDFDLFERIINEELVVLCKSEKISEDKEQKPLPGSKFKYIGETNDLHTYGKEYMLMFWGTQSKYCMFEVNLGNKGGYFCKKIYPDELNASFIPLKTEEVVDMKENKESKEVNLSEKAILTSNQAARIENRLRYFSGEVSTTIFDTISRLEDQNEFEEEFGLSVETFVRALINGYEIEQTREEKIVTLFEGSSDKCREAIKQTLAILGEQIEGVNK